MIYECFVLKEIRGRIIDKVAIKGHGKMEKAENYFSKKHRIYGLRYVKYVKTEDVSEYEQLKLYDS